MRLSGSLRLVLELGLVLSTTVAANLTANAQNEPTGSSREPGARSGAKSITYNAVLPQQQPAQDPNAPNQPPSQQPAPNQPAPQQPERKPKYKFYVGPDIGVYMPTSTRTRDRFGSDWLSYGVGISSISTPRSSGRFSPDIQILSQSKGDDSMFFGLIGVEYQQALIPGQGRRAAKAQPGQPNPEPPHNRDYIPYFGFSVYEAVGDLVAVEDGVHSGVRTGVAGAAFLGIEYKNRAYIQAKYLKTSELKSFDLSGFSIAIGYRFKIVGY